MIEKHCNCASCAAESESRKMHAIDGGLGGAVVSENSRVAYLIHLDTQIKRLKYKRAQVANIVRNAMMTDGVLRSKHPAGVVILKPSAYWDTPSARRRERARFGCNLHGRRDPYLVVIPTGGPGDAA